MKTILILFFLAALLFIYQLFIHHDPDMLDRDGNQLTRRGKAKNRN